MLTLRDIPDVRDIGSKNKFSSPLGITDIPQNTCELSGTSRIVELGLNSGVRNRSIADYTLPLSDRRDSTALTTLTASVAQYV